MCRLHRSLGQCPGAGRARPARMLGMQPHAERPRQAGKAGDLTARCCWHSAPRVSMFIFALQVAVAACAPCTSLTAKGLCSRQGACAGVPRREERRPAGRGGQHAELALCGHGRHPGAQELGSNRRRDRHAGCARACACSTRSSCWSLSAAGLRSWTHAAPAPRRAADSAAEPGRGLRGAALQVANYAACPPRAPHTNALWGGGRCAASCARGRTRQTSCGTGAPRPCRPTSTT
jgi:hypothetical protein